MPKPKGANDTQISVNVPASWDDELERLAAAMSPPGVQMTKSDAHRAALRRGLDVLLAEHPTKKKR